MRRKRSRTEIVRYDRYRPDTAIERISPSATLEPMLIRARRLEMATESMTE